MKMKLLVPATLAVALGFASWSAGAADSYTDAATAAKTMPALTSTSGNAPVYTADVQAAKSRTGSADCKMSAELPPDTAARSVSERAFRTGVTPASMFNLRDNAGG